MARRSRIPPTARKLAFAIGADDPSGTIDIGQCLSLLNRKGFRQGMEYYVESWSITSSVPTHVGLSYISQTWVNTNAWVKAFRTWLASQEQLPDFDEIKGRYHDFKVAIAEGQSNAGFAANFLPVGVSFSDVALVDPTISANWEASHIQVPNDGAVGVTNEYTLHMIGKDGVTGVGNFTKGIVACYALSRARPQQDEPSVPLGGSSRNWMDMLFDDGDNFVEIRSDLVSENDSPPYIITEDQNFEFYPGGSNSANGAGLGVDLTASIALNPATGAMVTRRAEGFVAPCGLVTITNFGDSAFILTLNIAVGPYKGVMARPMQDVN